MCQAGTSSGPAPTLNAAEQLELYRRVFAESVDGIAIIDLEGRYVEQNRAHELLTGYSNSDLLGKTPAIHLGEETFQLIAAALVRDGRFRGEVRTRSKYGQFRTLDLAAFSVLNEAGEPICFVGIKRDITRRRHAEDERDARMRELEAVYSLTSALNQAAHIDDIYKAAIDAVMSAVGCDRASILIFDDAGVMRFKAWSRLSESYRAAVEGHSPWSRETRDPEPIGVSDVRLDPGLKPYESTILREGIHALGFVPICYEGTLLGKFMLYFDQPHEFTVRETRVAQALGAAVSVALERHRSLDALRRSEQLATAGRLAASIAHEINNPLAAITNLVFLLRSRIEDPTSAKYLEALDAELTRVSQISRQTLGFYRDTSGPTNVDLCAVLRDTVGVFRPRFESRHLQLVTKCEYPTLVRASSGELRQVFSNLIVNAIDACAEGATITISVNTVGDQVHAIVADQGHGIEPEHLQRIFDPFFTTRKTGGTGLGLWITRQLVEKNNGAIAISTATGADHGTSVRMTFPALGRAETSIAT